MLTQMALLLACALVGSAVFKRVGAPAIVGMLAAGVLLGPSGFAVIASEAQGLLRELKTVALLVILLRAGLGIQRQTLYRIGGPALKLGSIPCVLEGLAVGLCSAVLLSLSFAEAGMLGFILAAVSPAVIVPQMLELKQQRLGEERSVPTLVLAGASLDDVAAITLFGAFAGVAGGAATNWLWVAVSVPIGIALGALIGAALGIGLVWMVRRVHLRDTLKVLVFLIVSILFFEAAEAPTVKQRVPVAALLGVMAIGFVVLERSPALAARLADKLAKVWVLAEILLFGYIGAELQLHRLSAELLVTGLAILGVGLLARSAGVLLSLWGSPLTRNERVFCMLAYVPKATVQAAMGAVPLSLVLAGRLGSTSVETAQTVLALAVLSIVVTAPLGALAIRRAGSALLRPGPSEPSSRKPA